MEIIKKGKYLISVIIGILIGLIFKEKATVLRPLGTIFVNLIFTIIVPLVFVIVTKNMIVLENNNKFKKLVLNSILVVISTLFITGIYTEVALKIYNPYTSIVLENASVNLEKINLVDNIVNMLTVNNFLELFNKSNILALIIVSILIGICINSLKIDIKKKIKNNLEIVYEIINKYLKIIMLYAPIGICAYLAALIGEYGEAFISQYIAFVLMYLILGILNILVFHTIYLFIAGGFKMVKSYYQNIFPVVITAFSTQSSVVTMPTDMNALENMNVDKKVIGLCTPILTLVNMQGNVIQNIMKIFLLVNLFSLPVTGIDYVFYIIIAIFAGSITAGIPGGGVISNTLLVSILSVSPLALPILITIEWLLDALATVFNVLSDTSTIPLIDKFTNKKGLKDDYQRRKKLTI